MKDGNLDVSRDSDEIVPPSDTSEEDVQKSIDETNTLTASYRAMSSGLSFVKQCLDANYERAISTAADALHKKLDHIPWKETVTFAEHQFLVQF